MSHQSDSTNPLNTTGNDFPDIVAVRQPGRMRAPRATDGVTLGEDAKGPEPTNRGPHNCITTSFKLLRFGIDSLYLSYQGDLFAEG